MSNPHKIVLVGFNSFERATFESFFRLAARRPPGYVLVTDPSDANLAVVNADDPATLSAAVAKKPSPHVMLIGSSDGGTGWVTQSRPLNLMKVLTNVELLLAPKVVAAPVVAPVSALASAPAPAPVMAPRPVVKPVVAATFMPQAVPEIKPTATSLLQVKPVAPVVSVAPAAPTLPAGAPSLESFTAKQPFVSSSRSPLAPTIAEAAMASSAMRVALPKAALPVATPAPAQRSAVRTGTGGGDFVHSQTGGTVLGSVTRPVNFEDEANLDHILVVDDSDIALKFMRNRLTRFGFRTDLVNSGEEALGRMNTRPYKFVFLDVMMEGMDGYQTCRAIKQRKYTEGKPPVVVMLTSRGGTIDKIRGTLAGCDAYLTKPLNERDLIAVLAKHDRTVARGFQATNFGASAKSGFGTLNTRH